MTDPVDDLWQASADVSGVEVLSPAAQAVLDAAVTAYDDEHLYTLPMTRHAGAVAAAALRAAADQSCFADVRIGLTSEVITSEVVLVDHILAIANELAAPR